MVQLYSTNKKATFTSFRLNLLKEELSMPPGISMSLDMAKEPQMGLMGFLKGLLMLKFSKDMTFQMQNVSYRLCKMKI